MASGTHARQHWPLVVLAAFVITGFGFVAASSTADGGDLRPAGGDVSSLLKDRAQRVDQRRDTARSLRADIDALSESVSGTTLDQLNTRVDELRAPTGLLEAQGPGVRVALDDAPRTVEAPGLDPNVLVVHQQDIQAFVNALWAGGAEAVSLQGQRLISTTGIKCVGNTVVLDGVPYSPPYVIEAIGNRVTMVNAMESSAEVVSYGQYAERYDLGLEIDLVDEIDMKAYAGDAGLQFATATESSAG